MEVKKEYYNTSLYILSEQFLNNEQAFNYLNDEEKENYDFIEFDYAVASHFNYKNCAIFHKEDEKNE